jgi:hypothetical protein
MLIVETIGRIRREHLIKGEVDQGDRPRLEDIAQHGAQGSSLG